jgi:hypothetical protein
MTPAEARQLADLLDRDDVWERVADALDAARDKGPRARDDDGEVCDRNSSDVLDDVITTLRGVS